MKKLVIVDEYFVDTFGHFYEYNKAVKEIFDENNVEAVIYANKNIELPIQKELGAVPFFDGLSKNRLNKIPVLGQLINRTRFWLSLYNKIRELYRIEDAPGTVFFFTTVRWYNALAVGLAAATSKHKNILLYRFPFSMHPDLQKSLWGVATWMYNYSFKKMLRNRNVLFCTDSDGIAAEFHERYDGEMKVLPIPHIKDDYAGIELIEQGTPANFIVYAPGTAREEKGIGFITRTLEYMASIDHPLLKKITVVTQYYDGADKGLNDNIRGRLKKLPVKNVFLGNMTTEAYYKQLSDAHIILITYDIDCGYKARTSGILSETIAACKPFITSKESWMSIQAIKYGTGLSITYNSEEQFINALTELTDNYAVYKKQAFKAKAGWLAYHSKQNFYNLLQDLINTK